MIDCDGCIVPRCSPEKEAAQFNQLFPVGTRVRYWVAGREGRGKEGVTCTKAHVLSGIAVVCIEGVTDCLALSRVQPC